MYFGLKKVSQTLQRHMDRITIPFGNFPDDIVIISKSKEEHKHRVKVILEKLEKNKRVKDNKYMFHQTHINFLGFWIVQCGIKTISEIMKTIIILQSPNNIKALRRFLGVITFYQWMIPNLSQIMAPLHELVAISIKYKRKYACQSMKLLFLTAKYITKDCSYYSNKYSYCVMMHPISLLEPV